jgi:hypothetical protein
MAVRVVIFEAARSLRYCVRTPDVDHANQDFGEAKPAWIPATSTSTNACTSNAHDPIICRESLNHDHGPVRFGVDLIIVIAPL